MFEIKSAELPLTRPRGVLRIGEVSGRPGRARVRFGDILGSDGQKVTSRTKSPDSSYLRALATRAAHTARSPDGFRSMRGDDNRRATSQK